MKCRILISAVIISVTATVLVLSACSKDESAGDADLNTIRPYRLTSEEEEVAELFTPRKSFSAVTQFTVDESYTSVRVGYDYYEKGKLIDEDCREMEMNFDFEDGPQISSGKICTIVNEDNIDVNIMIKGRDTKEESAFGSGSSLLEDDRSFADISSILASSLEDGTKIEKGKKIPIWAYIGSNNDTLSVPGIKELMAEKELLSSYDKCCVFYAKFIKGSN